jgi:hypothetical protein
MIQSWQRSAWGVIKPKIEQAAIQIKLNEHHFPNGSSRVKGLCRRPPLDFPSFRTENF